MFELEFPTSERVARLIWGATMAAWGLCLGGKTWPAKEEQYERMKQPQAGDMVVEVGGGMRERDCAGAVGWLLRETREPVFSAEEWNVEEDGPMPLEKVVYIRTIDGCDEHRWTNCQFIAVPSCEGWWNYPHRWGDPLASADTHPEGEDAKQASCASMGSAGGKAETPSD